MFLLNVGAPADVDCAVMPTDAERPKITATDPHNQMARARHARCSFAFIASSRGLPEK
jgi:hypothetical protein